MSDVRKCGTRAAEFALLAHLAVKFQSDSFSLGVVPSN
jgi:hypothetical protein